MHKTLIITGVHKEEAQAGRELAELFRDRNDVLHHEILNPVNHSMSSKHDGIAPQFNFSVKPKNLTIPFS